HSHVVAGGAVHPGTREAGTAEDVAAADHDRHLDAHAADLGDLPRDPPDHGRIDAVVELAHERLARELQQHAAIEYRGVAHPSCLPRCAAPDGPVAAAGLRVRLHSSPDHARMRIGLPPGGTGPRRVGTAGVLAVLAGRRPAAPAARCAQRLPGVSKGWWAQPPGASPLPARTCAITSSAKFSFFFSMPSPSS